MKIIKTDVPAFKPVTIVLESQGEVDFFANLVGATCAFNVDGPFGINSAGIYSELDAHIAKSWRRVVRKVP